MTTSVTLGASTPPRNGAQVMRLNAVQAIADGPTGGGWQAIVFDTVVFDAGGYANLGAHPTRLTVPTSGLFVASFSSDFVPNSVGVVRGLRIFKNGAAAAFTAETPPIQPGATTVFWWLMTAGGAISLNAGDYIEGQQYQDSGGALNVDQAQAPNLSIVRVGE